MVSANVQTIYLSDMNQDSTLKRALHEDWHARSEQLNSQTPQPKNNLIMSDFMPDEYEVPKTVSGYAKLEDGDNKFRILSKPIIGWVDWKDQKPVRFAMNNKPEKPFDPAKEIKHFWAVIAWNCVAQRLQILEITQGGLQKKIIELSDNADWGAPYKYDITITKEGTGLKTKYSLVPSPPKPISEEIIEAFKAKPIQLDLLFTSDDPFIPKGTPTPMQS